MNILVVIPTLGYGGAERLLVTLLPKLKDNGVNLKVCTFSTPLNLASELEHERISVVNLGLRHRWSVLEAIIKLHKEFKRFNPDFIWSHLYFGILYSRVVSLFSSRLKIVSVLHYNISSDSVNHGLWYSFRNWIFDKSRKLDYATVAVSESVKYDYQEYFGWDGIQVIVNVIDIQKIDTAILEMSIGSTREKYKISSNDYVIVLPGRLHQSKGHKFLVEAVKILKDRRNIVPQIIFAGEGSLKNELVNFIVELGLSDQFILTGELQQSELFRVMKASDLVVIPSLFEAFGIAAIEGMYLEKPLVITAIDGLKEITTDDMDVVQVPVKNSDALAGGILKIMKDLEYANYLANNAKNTASAYDVNIITEQWIDIFEVEQNRCVE